MDRIKTRRITFVSALAGAAAGFLLLHPYTMMVYVLHERRGVVLEDVVQALVFSFDPSMLDMGAPFALLGAACGLFFGLWQENRKRRIDLEKQLARWVR